MMFLGNLNFVAIAVIGGLRVASGAMSLGDIQAFIQYSRQFTQPITQLASMANVLQSGIASAERIFELLDAEEESDDDLLPAFEGDVLGPSRVRSRGLLVRPGEPAHRRPVAGRRARPDRGHRRAYRRGQDHPGQPDHAVLRDRRRGHHPRRSGHLQDATSRPSGQHGHGASGHLAVWRDASGKTSPSAT